MKRIILAFLALMGLVAQGAPVQARMCGVGSEQVGAVSSVRVQRQALTAQVAPSAAAVAKPDRKDRDCTPAAAERKRPVYIPAVQLGSDRARE
ncbi:hypothetical protein [Novosphingobium sp.]|uniref:hypothetical protein n=1 Tax=Novosphingobium sp. TaxID=1874826 RepID=UPI00286E8ABE|nr:hypothetical protein [Novosphingobium sp.]